MCVRQQWTQANSAHSYATWNGAWYWVVGSQKTGSYMLEEGVRSGVLLGLDSHTTHTQQYSTALYYNNILK